MAEENGRRRRDLPSAALDTCRGASAPERRSASRGRGGHRAGAGGVEGESSSASASHRRRRRQAAIGPRQGRAARLQDGHQPRRRAADQRGDRRTARRVERTAPGAWALGRSRFGETPPDARRVSPGGSGRREGRPVVPRSDAPSRRRAVARRHGGRERSRLVARRRRSLAGGHARRPSRSGVAGGVGSRRRVESDAAAVSAGRRSLAAPALDARPGRMPRRRHGPRQDDAGAGAPVGAASARRRRSDTALQPAGRASITAGQLGCRDRAFRPEPHRDGRAPLGDDQRRPQGDRCRSDRRRRPRDHELWIAPARAGIACHAVAPRDPGRSAGDQVSRRQADACGQADQRACAHRAERHPRRKPPWRSVVDLRLSQSRPAGFRQGILRVHEAAVVTTAQSVRTPAVAGASLHPAAPEDRQVRDRRPAGQGRDESLLCIEPQAGRALSAGGG